MYELTYSLVIFLSVLMIFFGYIAGNARNFNFLKFAFLLALVLMFISAFNHSQTHLIILGLAFAFGYFLPHMHILRFIGDHLSDFINSIRYRSDYKNIEFTKEELRQQAEELEKLRRSFEEARQAYYRAEQEFKNKAKQQKSGESGKSSKSQKQSYSQNNSSKKQSKSRSYSKQSSSSASGNSREHYLKLLGLDPSKECTLADLKKAYKRMQLKYHPDRHPNISDEERKRLDKKLIEFRRAFEWLEKNI